MVQVGEKGILQGDIHMTGERGGGKIYT